MTWSYDPTLAADRDKVRFEIQDTETSDQLFSNEEIDARLSACGTVSATALDLARKLMIKFARLVDTTVGKVSRSASQRFEAYKQIVYELEKLDAALAMPLFGGVNVAKNDALDSDTSVVQPLEKVGDTDDLGSTATFGGGSR